MQKTVFAIAAMALLIPATAMAHGNGWHRDHGGYSNNYYGDGYSRYDARYDGPREWRGADGRTYCRKSDGTVGLIVGGGAGALLGRAIDTRGERATGTILGAAAGALLGREVARKRRCR